MKKTVSLVMALLLTAMLICSCSLGLTKSDVVGSWIADSLFNEEDLVAYLENMGFAESEIALAPRNVLKFVEKYTFNEDGTYKMQYSAEDTKASFLEYYDIFIGVIYSNIASLEDVYGEGAAESFESLDDFKGFYAYIYEFDTYDDYLEAVWDEVVVNFNGMDGTPLEEGTYTVESEQINFKMAGDTEFQYVNAKLGEDGKLTLEYTNSTAVLTKK